MRDVCFASNVCLRSDVGRKCGKYWEGISASLWPHLSGEEGVNRSRISKRTRCKFSCCNPVSHLIRPTTFCLYCTPPGGKDCESYLLVVTLPSLNGRYVRGWKRKGSRYNKYLFFLLLSRFLPLAISFPPSSCYASYLERVKRDEINEIKGSEKAFYFPPFRLYREWNDGVR